MTGSLVGHLTRRLLLAGAILTALNIGFVTYYYLTDLDSLRREKVDHEIERMGKALRYTGGRVAFAPDAGMAERFARHPEAYGFRIDARDGTRIAEANAGLIPADARGAVRDADASWVRYGSGESTVLVGSRRFMVGPESVQIVFVAARDPSNLLLFVFFDELLRHVLVPLIPFALLLTLVNVVTVGRSLASLRRASQEARRLGERPSITPISAGGLPDEVRTLVEAVNGALQRIAMLLDNERAFAAEAAHALRTPLAILSARIVTTDAANLPAGLAEDVARMGRLVDQLLSVAQADTLQVSEDARCDIAAVATEVAAVMAPMVMSRGCTIAVDTADPPPVWGDADALAHAVRNLVDNALKASPAGGEITIEAGPGPTLSVRDRGPGFSAAALDRARQRFWRGPESGRQGGTGLGLAIVDRIAQAHGGRLDLTNGRAGGARASLVLRAAEAIESAGRAKSDFQAGIPRGEVSTDPAAPVLPQL